MTDISVAILGFGRIGASVALALRRYNAKGGNHHFKIAGFDTRPSVEKKAASMKLADEFSNRAFNAARNRDIVIVAMPYAEVQAIYELIGPDLRDGCVVIDMSPLSLPSAAWADKYLQKEAHLVSVTAVVNPDYLFEAVDDIDHAHEDLFDKGTMLLMPGPSCIKGAVELTADFAQLLGAIPHFVDPAEHDGLIAATEGLPALLGVTAFYMFSKSQGWGDGQRMINPAFGALTHHLFDTHPDDIRDTWLKNRENLLRYADDLIGVLQNVRSRLAVNDQAALEALLVEASTEYEQWINRRVKSRWDRDQGISTPSPANDMLRGVMGGYLAGKLTSKKKGDDE